VIEKSNLGVFWIIDSKVDVGGSLEQKGIEAKTGNITFAVEFHLRCAVFHEICTPRRCEGDHLRPVPKLGKLFIAILEMLDAMIDLQNLWSVCAEGEKEEEGEQASY
jgi:hypothetical protein